jgi:hypothetical protein
MAILLINCREHQFSDSDWFESSHDRDRRRGIIQLFNQNIILTPTDLSRS